MLINDTWGNLGEISQEEPLLTNPQKGSTKAKELSGKCFSNDVRIIRNQVTYLGSSSWMPTLGAEMQRRAPCSILKCYK